MLSASFVTVDPHCGWQWGSQWEMGATGCLEPDPTWARSGEQCKMKFEKLAFLKKPTGTSEIPVHVKRAKIIKDLISKKEVIGYVMTF